MLPAPLPPLLLPLPGLPPVPPPLPGALPETSAVHPAKHHEAAAAIATPTNSVDAPAVSLGVTPAVTVAIAVPVTLTRLFAWSTVHLRQAFAEN
jgi:hypothetical protein